MGVGLGEEIRANCRELDRLLDQEEGVWRDAEDDRERRLKGELPSQQGPYSPLQKRA